jgi:arginyl-tRNA synthetase
MNSETPKNYINHMLSVALSDLKLTSHLDSLDISIPTDPSFGDYSCNAALVLAKRIKQSPKAVADKIIGEIKKIDKEKKLESILEKNGFINFKLSANYLLSNLQNILEHGQLYGSNISGEGKVVLVEYFANNVAKPPHVGHLRSAVIGDCLLRVLRSQGYKAVSDTHIGDWGTQFGILLYAYKTMGNKTTIEKDPINELNKLYIEMSAKIEADAALHEKGKEEFAKLEKGDTENRELWQWFVRVSLEDFNRYRKLLDILPFDHNLGESFYEDKMPAVIEDLKSKGLLVESEGAQIVNLEDAKLGIAVLIKSDGATTYLLRDLATVKYRVEQMKLYKALYVVDDRQSHHFDQTFEISLRAGYITHKDTYQHLPFGFMSLPEGAISTRKGTTVSLQNLIDEAQKRALAIIEQKNPELANKEAIAKEVGLAAIKYFDLSHNRKSEIVFTWDKALSFEGNTGPYLQYTHARIQGILRRVQAEGNRVELLHPHASPLHPLESAVLRKLVKFPEVVAQVAEDYFPNNLCNYLFELSQNFNSFYQEVSVLQETNEDLRSFRLNLITATAQVLSNGLYLLGIEAPEEM